MNSVYGRYLNKVRPMHEAFVEPSRRHADVIIPEGGKNMIALEMVAAKIRDHLSSCNSA